MDFDSITLSKGEKRSIRHLRRKKELHRSDIEHFDSLSRYGFLEIAHKEGIQPDGYGGYITDEVYRLSAAYRQYAGSRAKAALKAVIDAIGAARP